MIIGRLEALTLDEPLLDAEQATALLNVRPRGLRRFARAATAEPMAVREKADTRQL